MWQVTCHQGDRNPTRWIVSGIYLIAAVLAAIKAAQSTILTNTIVLAAAAVVFAVLCTRAPLSAICMSNAGVIGRADRFTRRLRWDEIERFELRPRRFGGLVPSLGLGVWKRNGRWIRLMDYGIDPQSRYTEALQVLQQRLISHASDAGE